MGLPVGVVAILTVVFSFGAFVIGAAVGVCVIFPVAVVGGGSAAFLFALLVGIGGLTMTGGLLLGTAVAAAGFLVVVGAAVVVGFLSITNSASQNRHEKTHVSQF